MSTRSTKKVITEPFDLSNIKTTAQAASTMRKRKRIFGLEEAPTFYPTKEEFKDPLAYIEKISAEGAKYGIIKIIPPSDYKPEFCLNTEVNSFYIKRARERDIYSFYCRTFASKLGFKSSIVWKAKPVQTSII